MLNENKMDLNLFCNNPISAIRAILAWHWGNPLIGEGNLSKDLVRGLRLTNKFCNGDTDNFTQWDFWIFLDENGKKRCSKCQITKDTEDFKTSNNSKDGYKSACMRCEKNSDLLSQYGITLKQYEAIEKNQNHCCAICESKDSKIPRKHRKTKIDVFCVDHDHDTGEIRGLLCFNCNTGLGQFKDSADVLGNALCYLRKFNCTKNEKSSTNNQIGNTNDFGTEPIEFGKVC